MTALIMSMLRTRRVQNVLVLLLAATAAVVAMTGPAFTRSVDDRLAVNQFDSAPASQHSISLVAGVRTDADNGCLGVRGDDRSPADHGFTWLRSSAVVVATPSVFPAAPRLIGRVAARQDQCAHMRMLSGRCRSGCSRSRCRRPSRPTCR